MKKITYVLLTLLVCATLIGTASAFTYTSGAVVDPSGSLSPGEAVTASMTIALPKDSISTSGSLKLTTALRDSTLWTVYVYKGTVINNQTSEDALITQFSSTSFAYTISGFVLDYDQPVTLYIALNGLIPESLKGQSVTILKIDEDSGSATAGGYSTYSTPSQMVYNPDDFPNNLATAEERMTSLESRISTYIGYNIDVSNATTNLQSAKTSLAAAKAAGTADITLANKNLEASITSLDAAETALSVVGLETINTNINNVSAIIEKLNEMGWDSNKVTNLKSDNTNINTDVMRYESTGSPDVDVILKDSQDLLSTAQEYLESATTSPFAAIGSVLPIIIVIVVAVVVVLGAIVFIRRRRGGWDELG